MTGVRPRPHRWLIVAAVLSVLFTGFTLIGPRLIDALQAYRELRTDEQARSLEHFGDLVHVVMVAARSSSKTGVDRGVPAAHELIQMLPSVPAWYEGRGDAMHYAHLVLGRHALSAGDVEKAREELLEAGKTPGSIPLAAFGPDMTLAQELLDRGESQAVLQYLDECAHFWREGAADLTSWSETIEAGRRPNFGSHSGFAGGKKVPHATGA
jgi:hypothetical protein